MVLVSYPKVIIRGVNLMTSRPERGNKKRAVIFRPVSLLTLGACYTNRRYLRDYVDGKIPNALALTTAFALLLTPSLRANSNLSA